MGIDGLYYKRAYPLSCIIYGLYPIREPDEGNLEPMRDGDLNCIARRVIEHFEGALRGQGLTLARRKKIDAWEAEVHEGGATLQGVVKRAIIVRDIAGFDLYNKASIKGSTVT